MSVVWPPARYVAGVLGAGLVFAAVTNTCAMGMALARLPYNRRAVATCDMPTVVSQITNPQITNPQITRPHITTPQEVRS